MACECLCGLLAGMTSLMPVNALSFSELSLSLGYRETLPHVLCVFPFKLSVCGTVNSETISRTIIKMKGNSAKMEQLENSGKNIPSYSTRPVGKTPVADRYTRRTLLAGSSCEINQK